MVLSEFQAQFAQIRPTAETASLINPPFFFHEFFMSPRKSFLTFNL